MPIQPDLEYHAYLAAGRFALPADAAGRLFYPPRAIVPGDGSEEVRWVELSGRGTVHAATTVHRRPPDASYNVSLIDLAEGPRMMSRVEDVDPAEVRIGMAVTARIVTSEDGRPYVVFAPDQPR